MEKELLKLKLKDLDKKYGKLDLNNGESFPAGLFLIKGNEYTFIIKGYSKEDVRSSLEIADNLLSSGKNTKDILSDKLLKKFVKKLNINEISDFIVYSN